MLSLKQSLLRRRRDLRNFPTEDERRLWFVLRRRKLCRLKFRRQYSIGIYILDFYCPSRHLAIEVDGARHFTSAGKEYDRIRTDYLSTQGIRVVRVTNYDVLKNMEGVVGYLAGVVQELPAKNRK